MPKLSLLSVRLKSAAWARDNLTAQEVHRIMRQNGSVPSPNPFYTGEKTEEECYALLNLTDKLMNRFLLFGGQSYYPVGGFNDFLGSFQDLHVAMTKTKGLDWYHIFDMEFGGIVDADGEPYGFPEHGDGSPAHVTNSIIEEKSS